MGHGLGVTVPFVTLVLSGAASIFIAPVWGEFEMRVTRFEQRAGERFWGTTASPWIRAGVYLFLLFFLLVGVHIFLQQGLGRRRDYVRGRWNKVAAGEINAELLLVGSSRAAAHYDAKTMGEALGLRCYNMGAHGTFLNLQAPLLSLYLDYNQSPDLILIDVHSLSPRAETYEPSQYVSVLNNQGIYRVLLERDRMVWAERFIPFFSICRWGLFRAAIVGWISSSCDSDLDAYGYFPNDRVWSDQERAKEVGGFPNKVSISICNAEVQHLDDMLAEAQFREIPVVLVYSPVWFEFRRFVSNQEKVITTFKTLADKYQVQFWDYSEEERFLNKDLFSNCSHLNTTGATLFSSNIVERIELYLKEDEDAF